MVFRLLFKNKNSQRGKLRDVDTMFYETVFDNNVVNDNNDDDVDDDNADH